MLNYLIYFLIYFPYINAYKILTLTYKSNLYAIKKDNISHVIFTLTDDLNAAFPAKFVRLELDWSEVAMICCHELDVPNSLRKCLRVLIVVNVDEGFEPKFVYLKGAEKLRQS